MDISGIISQKEMIWSLKNKIKLVLDVPVKVKRLINKLKSSGEELHKKNKISLHSIKTKKKSSKSTQNNTKSTNLC